MTVFSVGDRVVWTGQARMGNKTFAQLSPEDVGIMGTVARVYDNSYQIEVNWDERGRRTRFALASNCSYPIDESAVFIEGDDDEDCV